MNTREKIMDVLHGFPVPFEGWGTYDSGAVLSNDRQYRFLLWRRWEPDAHMVCYVGLNPSTADSEVDDATVKKWRGFAKQEGRGGFFAINLYALRATNPQELKSHPSPIGEHTDWLLRAARGLCNHNGNPMPIVPCWGANAPQERHEEALAHLGAYSDDGYVFCFGRTKAGFPKHPLMLPYSTELEAF